MSDLLVEARLPDVSPGLVTSFCDTAKLCDLLNMPDDSICAAVAQYNPDYHNAMDNTPLYYQPSYPVYDQLTSYQGNYNPKAEYSSCRFGHSNFPR